MAKPKTSAPKPSPAKKKPTKPAAKKPAASEKSAQAKRAGKKKTATLLTAEQRQAMLKPAENAPELVRSILNAWEASSGFKVANLTRAKMDKLLRDAIKTREKEDALARKQSEQLRPLSDARLIANDALWRAVLEVHATAGFHARNDPALKERFAFLTEAFSRKRAPKPTATPTPVPYGGEPKPDA